MPSSSQPEKNVKPFLHVRVKRIQDDAELLGLCAGYEMGAWRAEGFARYLIRNLPQFILPVESWDKFNTATGVEQLSRAARTIYTTDKYKHRGEVGELLLFSIMREYYNSEQLISKFYFKSSANDTVKGFDAVHVVMADKGAELWLGEVKFYSNLPAAMRDVIVEIKEHLEINYMRDEFMWIENKMQDGIKNAPEIRHLLDDSTSLDEVFKVLHIPILLTYKSPTIAKYTIDNDEYKAMISDEINNNFDIFNDKSLPKDINIHLILVPLAGKARLLKEFDDRLKSLQEL